MTPYYDDGQVTIYNADCRDVLPSLTPVDLIVTSPPYNIGKEYESRLSEPEYLATHREVIDLAVPLVRDTGSICWQVGSIADDGDIVPVDYLLWPEFRRHGLQLRNRIAWTFGHGLHCSRRFSGRHEVVLWFTKTDGYQFHLDDVRVPSLYPMKRHYKGPKKGQLSGNPLGKNPGDVWSIANVKHNHPEKTDHPCQFPEELVSRLIRALTQPGDVVLDPFMGSGTTLRVAKDLGRRAIGIDVSKAYCQIATERLAQSVLPLEVLA